MAGLGGSVGCAVWLETRRSRVHPPPRSATFFRGDWSWNIFYAHSLPSADSRRAVVSFWRKKVHNTGYVWLGKLTALDMTPLGWLGHKTSTQTNKQWVKAKFHTKLLKDTETKGFFKLCWQPYPYVSVFKIFTINLLSINSLRTIGPLVLYDKFILLIC